MRKTSGTYKNEDGHAVLFLKMKPTELLMVLYMIEFILKT